MTEKSMISYEDMQFGPIAPGSPVDVAMLWGNPVTGPAAVLVRFPEGYAEPWHSHSSTYHAVLIKGDFQTRSKDGATDSGQVCHAGSYLFQPGGGIHSEVNAGKGEMVAMVYFEGPVDFVMSE